jgi:hypothetical protein
MNRHPLSIPEYTREASYTARTSRNGHYANMCFRVVLPKNCVLIFYTSDLSVGAGWLGLWICFWRTI